MLDDDTIKMLKEFGVWLENTVEFEMVPQREAEVCVDSGLDDAPSRAVACKTECQDGTQEYMQISVIQLNSSFPATYCTANF